MNPAIIMCMDSPAPAKTKLEWNHLGILEYIYLPPGCPKSPLLKVQSAFWAILAGVELTEGVLFGQAPPQDREK